MSPAYGSLVRLVRMHGHPCRAVEGAIKAAYRLGPGWAVATIELTGDADADRVAVRTWLGY